MNRPTWKFTIFIAFLTFLTGFFGAWLLSVADREGRLINVPDGDQVSVQIAPDGSNKAIVWMPKLGGLGATISQPYQVWIQSERDMQVRRLVFEADRTEGVSIRWSSDAELIICYRDASIHHFDNRFVAVEQRSGRSQVHEIEAILRKIHSNGDC